jgi:phosphoribosyl 1,2-cyclic phosphate phosphodiesterase
MKLIVLGSGTSHGVPVIGCNCPVCRSSNGLDKRMRASLYVLGDAGERLVIDTGPEFRLQALRAEITRLDAVLLTHAHADHVHGLDDIRPLCREKPLPVYGNIPTLEEMQTRFSYVFKKTQRGGGKPRILPLSAGEPFRIGALTITPVPVKHGDLDILGWKISEGPAAGHTAAREAGDPGIKGFGEAPAHTAVYLTDTSGIPAASLVDIQRPDLLIIGSLRERPHETHFSFQQALTAAVGMDARRVYLTHISHDHLHGEIEDYCRTFREARGLGETPMAPAYDGLQLEL